MLSYTDFPLLRYEYCSFDRLLDSLCVVVYTTSARPAVAYYWMKNVMRNRSSLLLDGHCLCMYCGTCYVVPDNPVLSSRAAR